MASSPLSQLLRLPAGDRAELAIALWESLTDSERDGVLEVTDQQRAELDRRWAEHVENPASAVPWCEVRVSCWADRDAARGLQVSGEDEGLDLDATGHNVGL